MIAPRYESAPKNFEVWGMGFDAENQYVFEDKNLGQSKFVYDSSGKHLQLFDLHNSESYQYIQFRVLDNYGSDAYTCLYRFRCMEILCDVV
eukprot:TRINITY_DN68_c0_g1_i2.p2 TRINITY_DN68_c0_g1~~TRINITY_DN68_c0_g1_i2.p2  ORF type:complete len:91 (+),score=21.70 TRINITY_DN68_c0_g1_i2:246-518(+)